LVAGSLIISSKSISFPISCLYHFLTGKQFKQQKMFKLYINL
jgi:hypothetical protein